LLSELSPVGVGDQFFCGGEFFFVRLSGCGGRTGLDPAVDVEFRDEFLKRAKFGWLGVHENCCLDADVETGEFGGADAFDGGAEIARALGVQVVSGLESV
jgi:hypothetical protein